MGSICRRQYLRGHLQPLTNLYVQKELTTKPLEGIPEGPDQFLRLVEELVDGLHEDVGVAFVGHHVGKGSVGQALHVRVVLHVVHVRLVEGQPVRHFVDDLAEFAFGFQRELEFRIQVGQDPEAARDQAEKDG